MNCAHRIRAILVDDVIGIDDIPDLTSFDAPNANAAPLSTIGIAVVAFRPLPGGFGGDEMSVASPCLA